MNVTSDSLPFERTAARGSVFAPRFRQVGLPEGCKGYVSALAGEQGTSEATVFLAAWQSLLWRLTRAPQIDVGVRLECGVASIRAQFTDDTSLLGVLHACEPQLSAAIGRPRQVDVERRSTRAARIEIPYEFELAERRDERGDSGQEFKLKLVASGSDVAIGYDSDRYEDQDVAVLAQQYAALLEHAARSPQTQLASLSINGSEHLQLLRRSHGKSWRAVGTVADPIYAFERRVCEAPGAVALVAGSDVLSYEQLNRRANRLARHLRDLGIGPEVRVALCLDRCGDMLVAILAVLKAGGVYVPLDPQWPAERAMWILQESESKVLLSRGAAADHLHGADLEHVELEQIRGRLTAYSSEDLPRSALRDNAAYIIYTSGSTGRPKGVVVTRHSIARLFETTEDLFGFSSDDVWSMCHSYAFDYSVWEMWGAWLYGGKLVLATRVQTRSPEQLYELLQLEGVTILSQTPSGFRALLQELQRVPGRTLTARAIVFGGEALDPGMLRDLQERYPQKQLVNMYGITETTVHTTYKHLSAREIEDGGRSLVGVELDDLRVHVLNGDLLEAGVWETGELFIAGDGLARCYLKNPALTAERFIPEANGPEPGARMYRTGDLARRLPNGELEYLGRCDQQVKIRGFRIELGEIEANLRKLEGVREATVLLDRDDTEARLVAYVFPHEGRELAADSLREQLGASLPEYMVPAVFMILEKIPLTVNGKLDKRALPKPGTQRPQQEQSYVAPRTQLEQSIASIWAQVLRIETIGVQDNFFDLGGHSLLMVQLQERLRNELGLNVPVVELFARPNVSALAEFVAVRPASPAPTASAPDRERIRSRSSKRRREARNEARVPDEEVPA